MPSLIDLTLEGRKVGQYGPWPRVVVDASVWTFAASELAHGRWSLLGLWGEPATVHMAIMDGQTTEIAVVSLDCPDRSFPSVGKHHPPALRLERTINDLFGLSAEGSPDTRPWLDHNRWGVRFPLGDRIDALPKAAPYRFLPAEGDGLHQIAVGPVHAGIIEPGHFRFHRQRRNRGPAGTAAWICPQGHRRADDRRQPRARRPTRRPHVGRQHRRLCLCVFARGRSRAGSRRARSRACSCARCWQNSSGSPTISATSARSATMPPSH